MPLPLLAVAAVPVAAKIGIGVGVAVLGLIGIGVAAFKFKTANKNDEADLTVLLVGEQAAGKDAVMNLIENNAFNELYEATAKYYTIMTEVKGKKIKIINTSGSELTLEDTEEATILKHNIRCYVFNSIEFYQNKDIVKGINHAKNDIKGIEEKENRKIELIAIGTRGDSISNKDSIENDVRKNGVKCKIFELSKKPREEILKYIFNI